jgi:hypothetical protein
MSILERNTRLPENRVLMGVCGPVREKVSKRRMGKTA